VIVPIKIAAAIGRPFALAMILTKAMRDLSTTAIAAAWWRFFNFMLAGKGLLKQTKHGSMGET
jgi:hypothetical protein